jgi:hypothetical protein
VCAAYVYADAVLIVLPASFRDCVMYDTIAPWRDGGCRHRCDTGFFGTKVAAHGNPMTIDAVQSESDVLLSRDSSISSCDD